MRNAVPMRWIGQAESRRVPANVQPKHPAVVENNETIRLFVAAMSKRPDKNPTDFLAACVGFSPGG
jgi:hypothetical protein